MAGGFDASRYSRLDLTIVGSGVLALLCTFLPYYGITLSFAGVHTSDSVTAWHSYAILGILLVLAATVLAAVRVFQPSSLPSGLPVGPNLATAALAGLGTLLLVIRAFTYPHASGVGYSAGVTWGGYLLLLFGIVETAASVVAARAAGEKVPAFAPAGPGGPGGPGESQ